MHGIENLAPALDNPLIPESRFRFTREHILEKIKNNKKDLCVLQS
jgi:hypothetical protein